jgi:hypothetical protein
MIQFMRQWDIKEDLHHKLSMEPHMATFHNQYYSQLIVQSNFPQLLSKTIFPPNKV